MIRDYPLELTIDSCDSRGYVTRIACESTSSTTATGSIAVAA